MFIKLFFGYMVDELYIGYVMNSVYYFIWIVNDWYELYSKQFGDKFLCDQYNYDYWCKINKVVDEDIMGICCQLKKCLLDYVKDKIKVDLICRGQLLRVIFQVINNVWEDVLVFGFVCCFVIYKWVYLMFINIECLC